MSFAAGDRPCSSSLDAYILGIGNVYSSKKKSVMLRLFVKMIRPQVEENNRKKDLHFKTISVPEYVSSQKVI